MIKSFAALQLVFLLIFSVSAQQRSDRERAGLAGYVKSVRADTVEIVTVNGKSLHKGRRLNSVATYDISGRLFTYYAYTREGEILFGDTLIYDGSGRLVEKKTQHSESVYLCDRKTYVYDDHGRESEEICHLKDRGIIGKTVSRYDASGRLIEEERLPIVEAKLYFRTHTLKRYEYDSEGTLIKVANFEKAAENWTPINTPWDSSNAIHFANANTGSSTTLRYNSSGSLTSVETGYNDERGNKKESIVYLPDGRIKSGNRYVYTYDGHGNYIKEVEYEWISKNSKSSFQPSEITYRTINYFTKKEISEYRRVTRR